MTLDGFTYYTAESDMPSGPVSLWEGHAGHEAPRYRIVAWNFKPIKDGLASASLDLEYLDVDAMGQSCWKGIICEADRVLMAAFSAASRVKIAQAGADEKRAAKDENEASS